MLDEQKDTALNGLEAEEARLARVRDALFAVEVAQRNLDDAEKSCEKKEKGKKDKQLLDDARRLLSNEQARLSAAIGDLEVRELADLQAVCTLGGSSMDFASARALARGAWVAGFEPGENRGMFFQAWEYSPAIVPGVFEARPPRAVRSRVFRLQAAPLRPPRRRCGSAADRLARAQPRDRRRALLPCRPC